MLVQPQPCVSTHVVARKAQKQLLNRPNPHTKAVCGGAAGEAVDLGRAAGPRGLHGGRLVNELEEVFTADEVFPSLVWVLEPRLATNESDEAPPRGGPYERGAF